MSLLLKAILKSPKRYFLLFSAFIAIQILIVAEFFEAITLGVLTQTGTSLLRPFSDSAAFSLTSISKEGLINYLIQQLSTIFHFEHTLGFVSFFIFVAFFKGIASFAKEYTLSLIGIRVSQDLRLKYFEHIQRLPLSFYQKYPIGSLSTRVSADASVIANSINALLLNYVQTPIMVISMLVVCVFVSWKLSLVSFLALPLLVGPILFFTKRLKRIAKQMQSNQEQFGSSLIDFLGGIHTIKIFGKEQFAGQKYRQQNFKMMQLQEKSTRYSSSLRPVIHLISSSCLAAVIIYGFYGAKMQMSEMLVFCACLYKFYEPIKKFGEINAEIQKGVVAAERMFEVLDIQPEIQDAPEAKEILTFKNSIEFRDVWFRYQEEWVLKGLNITIEAGKTVALVGATGAGKSTIVQLLMRLYEPQKGEIYIDGLPLKKYTQNSLKELFGVVPQKPFLFLDSIAENISFGQNVSLQDVQAASIQAHAHEFIEKLPQDYQTILAEGGRNLSGGQQQRLAIARALVKKALILILDEATSSLDAISENFIQIAIQELQGKITQILIAHRLSTIEKADKIVYLQNRIKLAEGSKEQLLQNCPPFKHLCDVYFNAQQTL